METRSLVVVRYLDGRVLKGTTGDFSANRPNLHLELAQSHEMVQVQTRQLKAIFFVKAFDGYPDREDLRGFIDGPPEKTQGRKLAVRFRDGEFMCGYTMSWSPEREGFFLFPADVGGNNDRVYVLTAATAEVKAGPAADALAERVLSGGKSAGAAPGGTGPRPAPGAAPGQRPMIPGLRPPKSDAA